MSVINLTQAYINGKPSCPPDKRRYEYCDRSTPGLYYEARASGSIGTYFLRFKRPNDGRTAHKKIGRACDISLAEARRQTKLLRADIARGSDPCMEANARKAVPTFAEFTRDQYIPYIKARKRSWKNDERILRLHMLAVFGHQSMNRITRHQIQAYHTALREGGQSAASCDHHIKLIRYAYNLAVQWDVVSSNPAARIPLFREDNNKERYMTEEEQARLLHVLKTDKSRTICLLIFFLLSSGARLNEALKATWEDIDEDTRVWRISATNSKSKRIRSIPLNQTALQVLAELKKGSKQGHLFINPRTGERYVNPNKTWVRLRSEAGLPELRLHDLRHQFASYLINAGESLYTVQRILGHSDPSVTARYSHLSSTSLQKAANAASSRIGDLTT